MQPITTSNWVLQYRGAIYRANDVVCIKTSISELVKSNFIKRRAVRDVMNSKDFTDKYLDKFKVLSVEYTGKIIGHTNE